MKFDYFIVRLKTFDF